MQLPVQQFPVLPAGQMNPFHQALQTGLENYMASIKSAYEPARMQADIASKQAYSQYLPYQNISTVLSNPLALGMMSKDQRMAMFNALANMSSNIGNGIGQQQPSGISAIYDNLKNWAAGSTANNQVNPVKTAIGDYTQSHPEAAESLRTNGQYTIPNSSGANSAQAVPSNLDLSDTTHYAIDPKLGSTSGFDMSSPSANALGIDTGSPEGNRAMALKMPSPAFTNAVAQAKEKQVTEARTSTEIQQKELNSLQKEATVGSTNASNLLLNVNKFKDAYDKAWAVGPWSDLPVASTIAKFDPNANAANTYANNAAVEIASQLFGQRQSDYREKLAQQLKLSPKMPRETVNDVYQGIVAESQRAKEYSDFVQTAIDRGLNNPNKIRSIWFDYNRDKPFYDVKNRKVIQENLGSYSQYLDSHANKQNAFNKQQSSSSGIWPSGKSAINENKLQGQMPPDDSIWMIRPDGIQVPVHKQNIEMAKRKYKFRGLDE